MSLSNIRKSDYKIFVTGPFQAGKTTFIHTLDPDAISIERDMREEYRGEKGTTTTGFDLGRIVWARKTLESQGLVMPKQVYDKEKDEYKDWNILEIELRGVPGQLHFKFVRDTMRRNTDGVLLIVDSSDFGMIGDACATLAEVRTSFDDLPLVVVANKQDRPDSVLPKEVANWLGVSETIGMSGMEYLSSQESCITLLRLIETSGGNGPIRMREVEILSETK